MDWQQRLARALSYFEDNLFGTIDLDAAACEANCSTFHFYRMFEVVAGVTAGEYLRRRRLSEAARALSSGDEKVIDLAMRSGYDSPDAFARAFRREFGCTPSEARKPGARLHSFPPLAIRIVLQGDKPMEYRIEKMGEIMMAGPGIRVQTKDGINFVQVPAFWDSIMKDDRFEKLCAKMKKAPGSLGVAGVIRDNDMKTGEFTYSIAVDEPENIEGMPEGSERFAVPASTWGKFTSRGPLRPAFQETIKRIFSEWLPNSGWEHAGTAEIEYYGDGDPGAADYVCEYWIPLKKA